MSLSPTSAPPLTSTPGGLGLAGSRAKCSYPLSESLLPPFECRLKGYPFHPSQWRQAQPEGGELQWSSLAV